MRPKEGMKRRERWMGAHMRTSIQNNIIILEGSTYGAELRSARRTHVAKIYEECVSGITWEGMRRCDRWQRVHKGDGSRTNDKEEGGGDVTHVLATRR